MKLIACLWSCGGETKLRLVINLFGGVLLGSGAVNRWKKMMMEVIGNER